MLQLLLQFPSQRQNRGSKTTVQVTAANSEARNTAALPKSFAFFDSGLRSSDTRSTAASTAELSSSMISTSTSTPISSSFSSAPTGNSSATQTPGITIINS